MAIESSCGCASRGLMEFHLARASIFSIVSKLWACSPEPGMLCALVPMSIVIGGGGVGMRCFVVAVLSAWPKTPGASSSVNAR